MIVCLFPSLFNIVPAPSHCSFLGVVSAVCRVLFTAVLPKMITSSIARYVQVEEHPAAKALVVKVITISIVMAVVSLLSFGVSFALGISIWWVETSFSLLVSLGIPICGIVGAKNRNKQLICLFFGCSMFLAILSFMGGALLVWAMASCEIETGYNHEDCGEVEGAVYLSCGFLVLTVILQLMAFHWGRQL